MASLIDKATLAGDATFVARVKAALVERAATILAGPKPDDASGAARFQMAGRVMSDLNGAAALFIMSVAVDDAIADAAKTTSGVTDTAIRGRVATVWPYLANE